MQRKNDGRRRSVEHIAIGMVLCFDVIETDHAQITAAQISFCQFFKKRHIARRFHTKDQPESELTLKVGRKSESDIHRSVDVKAL
ncbi:hypothetical protein [Kalamiella sp. sgz302252]|uniref:hypothetical protein n=1 Tax=Pantoea sp. sgz302252 TaxID=3341827 RepID=UPI0036D2E0B0